MSKEIKEKCKECVYYNDKIEYPVVDGTTTHSNCMSIKCEYRKETKDMKIKRLTSKVADLEAKLADMTKKYELASCPTGGLVDRVRNLGQQLSQCEADRKFEQEKKNIAMKRVSELKQQLAESEEFTQGYRKECAKIQSENVQIKQQLAEKEKEIATLEVMLAENKNDIKKLQEFKVGDDEYDLTDSDARFSLECELLHKDQDKISFCIEQLEKVKEHLETEIGSIESFLDPIEYEDYHELLGVCRGYKNSIEEIDKQIENLKKERD